MTHPRDFVEREAVIAALVKRADDADAGVLLDERMGNISVSRHGRTVAAVYRTAAAIARALPAPVAPVGAVSEEDDK
jgi:hypothetical protein